MPELPEVEIVCEGLRKTIVGRRITAARASAKRLREPLPKNLSSIVGAKISQVSRRAKYILLKLSNGRTLIIHLGMSGKLTVRDKYIEAAHDHLVLTLSPKTFVVLNDPRRFGLAVLVETDKIDDCKFLKQLGVEPLEKSFTAKYLAAKLAAKKTAIKLAIMNQKTVVGVGNIYASEALFAAGINPLRQACGLSLKEVAALVSAIKKILKKSIIAGGSSLRDYVHADGGQGEFQNSHAVYGREGERCPNCNCDVKKTGGIKRITQGGRSTFYCTFKQK